MKTTTVNFILDRSGSMTMVREATISGFNEYIDTLKKDKKSKYKFTLTLFDTTVEQPVKGVAMKEVPDLNEDTYIPNGMTALYDAVCSTIKNVKAKKGDKVLTIIMTDGHENSSKEYTEKDMKKIIEEKTKDEWKFVYLGANQDSYAVAQKYGIGASGIANFSHTKGGSKGAFRAMSANTAMYAASADNKAAFFTKEDQNNIENN